MVDLDNFTLMMAVQAVSEKVKRYEQLLSAEDGNNKHEVTLLIDSYKSAAEKLQQCYLSTTTKNESFDKIAC